MNKKIPSDATCVFAGKLFQVYHKEMEQFDGSYKTFERVRAYDAAKALCIVDNSIIVLHTEMPWEWLFYQLPGGMIEPDEDPDLAVRREVVEETGITFGEFESLHTVSSNVWHIEAYKYYYIVRKPLSYGEQKLDAGERITVKYFSLEELIDHIERGEIAGEFWVWLLREYVLSGKIEELKKLLFG